MNRVEDTALLQAPFHIAKEGFEGIIEVWNDATIEVRNILNNECEILLQCRYHQSSLLNFFFIFQVYWWVVFFMSEFLDKL